MSRIYLYGFVPAGTRLPAAGLLGIADAPVELTVGDGFAAVLSRVPDHDFSDDALERSSASVEWMAEQGLRHEEVIAWFVDHAAILPSRLLTLFSSDARLADVMERDAPRIRGALERFRGLREWDLKVGYDAALMEPHLTEVSETIRHLDREMETAAPGKAFLLRKQRQGIARTESRAAAVRLAGQLLDDLATLAHDVSRVPPGPDQAPVVLNAALLLPVDREDEALARARREAARLEELGLTVQFTGPWAPYRFIAGEGD